MNRQKKEGSTKIIVDCRGIRPNEFGGVDTFTDMIIRGLAVNYRNITIDVSAEDEELYRNRYKNLNIIITYDKILRDINKFRKKNIFFKIITSILNRIYLQFGRRLLVRRASHAKRYECDLVINPFHLHENQYPMKVVNVVHSILPHYTSEQISKIEKNVYSSSAVITCWPWPSDDLKRRFFQIEKKLFTIPITTESNFKHHRFTNFSKEFGEYIFFPSVISPRKNHIKLIDAYIYGISNNQFELPNLVFCGGGDIKIINDLKKKVEFHNLKEKIFFLGYVETTIITDLYKNCIATISPSLFEAGYVTLQEGYLFAKPALCAKTSPAISHAEFLNASPIFFDPNDEEDICNAILYFQKNRKKYEHLAVGSQEVVKNMGLNNLSDKLVSVIDFCLDGRRGY